MCYIHYIIIFLLLVQIGISIYNLSYSNDSSNKENYQISPVFTGYKYKDRAEYCTGFTGDCTHTNCKEGDPSCFCVYRCSGTGVKFIYNCSASALENINPQDIKERRDWYCKHVTGDQSSNAYPL